MATTVPVATVIEGGVPNNVATAGDLTGNVLATNNGVTTFVEFINTAAVASTVTVPYVVKVDGKTIPVQSYSLVATIGSVMKAGPFPISLFGVNPVFTPSAVTVTFTSYQI